MRTARLSVFAVSYSSATAISVDNPTAIRVDGQPLEADRADMLAACEREGDADDVLCWIRGVADARTLELDVHAALRAQLAARDPITVVSNQRVIAEDLPPHILSQFERR